MRLPCLRIDFIIDMHSLGNKVEDPRRNAKKPCQDAVERQSIAVQMSETDESSWAVSPLFISMANWRNWLVERKSRVG
jgi:hypothetical protein